MFLCTKMEKNGTRGNEGVEGASPPPAAGQTAPEGQLAGANGLPEEGCFLLADPMPNLRFGS